MRKTFFLVALAAAASAPALLSAGIPTTPFEGPDLWTDPVPAIHRIKPLGTDLCVTRTAGGGLRLPFVELRPCASPIGWQSITLAPNGTTDRPLPLASPVTWRMTTPNNSHCLTAARRVVFGAPSVDEHACARPGAASRQGAVDQTWRLRQRGGRSVFEIRTLDNRCWTAQGGTARAGVQVVLERCDPAAPGQQWVIGEPAGNWLDSASEESAREFGWITVPRPGTLAYHRFRPLRRLNIPSNDYTQGIATINDQGEECAQMCAEDSQCRAFTWVDPRARGGTAMCYKKSGYGTIEADNFTYSGIVRPG